MGFNSSATPANRLVGSLALVVVYISLLFYIFWIISLMDFFLR